MAHLLAGKTQAGKRIERLIADRDHSFDLEQGYHVSQKGQAHLQLFGGRGPVGQGLAGQVGMKREGVPDQGQRLVVSQGLPDDGPALLLLNVPMLGRRAIPTGLAKELEIVEARADQARAGEGNSGQPHSAIAGRLGDHENLWSDFAHATQVEREVVPADGVLFALVGELVKDIGRRVEARQPVDKRID